MAMFSRKPEPKRIKQTAQSRHERLEALKIEIQSKKEMKIGDVYRFALREFGVGIPTITLYLQELDFRGDIKLTLNMLGQIESVATVVEESK